jgi:hypothetical protein
MTSTSSEIEVSLRRRALEAMADGERVCVAPSLLLILLDRLTDLRDAVPADHGDRA